MSAYQQPREEGRVGVELAIRCLEGEKLEREYPVEAPGITRENADKFEGQF